MDFARARAVQVKVRRCVSDGYGGIKSGIMTSLQLSVFRARRWFDEAQSPGQAVELSVWIKTFFYFIGDIKLLCLRY